MSFARAAKAVAERAAPLAGTAAVLATQAPVAAREAPGPSAALARIARIQDEFELVDMDGTRPIFSKPIFGEDDIAGAAQTFVNLATGSDEPDSEATSDGGAADLVIEGLLSPRGPAGRVAAAARDAELSAALAIATRVLRNPGVQREIALAALSDPEVLAALGARGPELDSYLLSQGFAARGLLPCAAGAGASARVEEVTDGGAELLSEGAGRDPLAALVDGAVAAIEAVGRRIADAGAWLRARLGGEADGGAEAAAEGEAAAGKAGAAPPRRQGLAGVMDKVGKVAVLLVLIIIFKRAGRF
ncbi:hypothetical protein Rsub_11085 [Raphidocelis subcapitata]|uniref:Uncharacterized protein n=1 Tax=Raphidocelis subcapitata TaxID=307507 RepID=A0A2V0PKN9_9CHLO|nr:hypothetical protein Rsub_11085 [Raphidocelis subcapitata]|eukprot:GBF98440.1 hypothetical protein Rsub_11085 [Raphidocelis subcapitata]